MPLWGGLAVTPDNTGIGTGTVDTTASQAPESINIPILFAIGFAVILVVIYYIITRPPKT